MVLSQYHSGDPTGIGYNITIEFLGSDWTEDLQGAFIQSAEFLSTIVNGDPPSTNATDAYGNPITIDDLYMTAELTAIDGVGNVLGQAGPTVLNSESLLPALGEMQFDTADAQNLYDSGVTNGTNEWNDVVLQEMLHVLGVGTLWSYAGLSTNFGTASEPDWRFTGAAAMHEYENLFQEQSGSDLNSGLGVPIQGDTDGPGGHWDEAIFDHALMTPYLDIPSDFTQLTLASMQDLGYVVDYTQTEVACFGLGTQVLTPLGFRNIVSLGEGEHVCMLSHGNLPVVKTHLRRVNSKTAPVYRILASALGRNDPSKDMEITGNHLILVKTSTRLRPQAPLQFLTSVQALYDSGWPGIAVVDCPVVVHVALSRHAVILANGMWAESMWTFEKNCAAGPENPDVALPIVRCNVASKLLRRLYKANGAIVANCSGQSLAVTSVS